MLTPEEKEKNPIEYFKSLTAFITWCQVRKSEECKELQENFSAELENNPELRNIIHANVNKLLQDVQAKIITSAIKNEVGKMFVQNKLIELGLWFAQTFGVASGIYLLFYIDEVCADVPRKVWILFAIFGISTIFINIHYRIKYVQQAKNRMTIACLKSSGLVWPKTLRRTSLKRQNHAGLLPYF